MMWQNAGGSGLDQWNFQLHPVQHSKFCDPTGAYVRKWIPELARLPTEYLHQPWAAPMVTLQQAGVALGKTYPNRIITDLAEGRARTISWFVDVKKRAGRGKCDARGYDLITLSDGHVVRVFTKPELRVTFQGNSAAPRQTVPSKNGQKSGQRQPHRNDRKGGRRPQSHEADEGTPMSEFAACLYESMQSYRAY